MVCLITAIVATVIAPTANVAQPAGVVASHVNVAVIFSQIALALNFNVAIHLGRVEEACFLTAISTPSILASCNACSWVNLPLATAASIFFFVSLATELPCASVATFNSIALIVACTSASEPNTV